MTDETPVTYAEAEALAREYEREMRSGAKIIHDDRVITRFEFIDARSIRMHTGCCGHIWFYGLDHAALSPAAFRAHWESRLQVYDARVKIEGLVSWDDTKRDLKTVERTLRKSQNPTAPAAGVASALRLAALCRELEEK